MIHNHLSTIALVAGMYSCIQTTVCVLLQITVTKISKQQKQSKAIDLEIVSQFSDTLTFINMFSVFNPELKMCNCSGYVLEILLSCLLHSKWLDDICVSHQLHPCSSIVCARVMVMVFPSSMDGHASNYPYRVKDTITHLLIATSCISSHLKHLISID